MRSFRAMNPAWPHHACWRKQSITLSLTSGAFASSWFGVPALAGEDQDWQANGQGGGAPDRLKPGHRTRNSRMRTVTNRLRFQPAKPPGLDNSRPALSLKAGVTHEIGISPTRISPTVASLPVAPLIPDKRCYGEAAALLACGQPAVGESNAITPKTAEEQMRCASGIAADSCASHTGDSPGLRRVCMGQTGAP